MRFDQSLLALTVALSLVGCATTANRPAGDPSEGTSCDKPVVIQATSDFAGTAEEYDWLREHYPGYKKLMQTLTKCGEKPADVLTIKTAEGEERKVFFDISNSFGH